MPELSVPGSITCLIRQLDHSEELALESLFRRCWGDLIAMASKRLAPSVRSWSDEEDIASEAYWGFVRALRKGRLPKLQDRCDLFALFAHIVACRAATRASEKLSVNKRGAGKVRAMSEVFDSKTAGNILNQVPGREPSPDERLTLQECFDVFIDQIPESLRPVAYQHLLGHSQKEIAGSLDCTTRTIERKMALIRNYWNRSAQSLFGFQ